jgi:hypothetical protein
MTGGGDRAIEVRGPRIVCRHGRSLSVRRADDDADHIYGGICGWSLARAHARTGDAAAISAYLGSSDKFDGAIADDAETYADVTERDHAAYLERSRRARYRCGRPPEASHGRSPA